MIYCSIAGQMTDCPGYVNARVDIWPTSPTYRPLANYDILVSCPPSFSLSFSLPLHVADVTAMEDCILECVFDDGKRARRLLLRPVFDRRQSFDPPHRWNETTERSTGKGVDEPDTDLPTFGVAVLLATSITLTVVSLFGEVFRLTTAGRRGRRRMNFEGPAADSAQSSLSVRPRSQLIWMGDVGDVEGQVFRLAKVGRRGRRAGNFEGSAAAPSSLSSQPRRLVSVTARRACRSAVVVARLVYAFAFTFSVFTTLVGVALHQQVDNAATSSPEPIAAVVEKNLTAVTYRRMAHCLAGSTIQLTGNGRASSRRFGAVADLVASSFGSSQKAAAQWARQAAERIVATVEVALKRQGRYGHSASLNHWLLFPRALYNKTAEQTNRTSAMNDASLTTNDTFWRFMQVTPLEVGLSSLWTANIRER